MVFNPATAPVAADAYTFQVTAGGSGSVDVTVTAGAATQVRVETAANGSGTVVPAQSVASGSSITVFAISRDTNGNFVANVSATWSLTNKTAGVVNGDLVGSTTSTTGTSATFTGHLVGTATIHAVNGALTSVDSGTITVTPGPVSAAQSTVSASPTSVIADGSTTSTITVTLKDASGNPVAGKTVSLAKTSGPGTPTISAPSGSQ